ncbi:MAG: hypothetical protein AAGE84_19320 [Cyanobacteria bacterium P01_G01_bin.39]
MSQNLLENISAVEISTVIVAEIVDEVFIPWSAYQGIYQLNRSYLEQSGIDLSLHHRYLQLRRQLELAYCLLLIDPNSKLYNRTLVREIKRDLPILSQQNSDWSTLVTRLPEPIPQRRHESMSLVNKLLTEPQLINVLQQLDKLKVALDRRDRILRESHQDSITDTTFAQTSLQLNGKIINRYSEAILERSDRNLLLQLHQQSTTTGEKQWRGLINFMLSVIAKP